MNLRAEIRLKPTRNSASSHSSRCPLEANKKLLLISEIADPPTGIRKQGQTESLIAFTTLLNSIYSICEVAFSSLSLAIFSLSKSVFKTILNEDKMPLTRIV